ncbi:MAG: ATP-binding protein [Pseudomonadota bacterium]
MSKIASARAQGVRLGGAEADPGPQEHTTRAGETPAPFLLSLAALGVGAGFAYLAAIEQQVHVTLALLSGAAAAGGFGVYGVAERLMLKLENAGRDAGDTFEKQYGVAPEPTALLDSSGRVRALNRAARAELPGKVDRAVLLLEGVEDADARVFRLLRDAFRGRSAKDRIRLGDGRWIEISVWPSERGLAVWRWKTAAGSELSGPADAARLGWLRIDGSGAVVESNAVFDGWVRPPGEVGPATLNISNIFPEAARRLLGGGAERTMTRTRMMGGSSAPRSVSLMYSPTGEDGGVCVVAPAAPGRDEANVVAAGAPDKLLSALDTLHTVRLVEDAPIGVAVLSADGKVLRLNGAADRLLSADGALGAPLIDAIMEEDRPEAVRRLTSVAASTAADGPAFEARLRAPDGQTEYENPKVAQFYFSRVETNKGRLLLAYIVDASEQRALEERFNQGQKLHAVGQLAGGVAHDFNNLLTVINAASEMLLQRHGPGDPDFEDLNVINQNAHRAANLVRQLLAFSRKQTMRLEQVNLTDQISEVGHLLNRLIGEKIVLRQDLADELWPVRVDANQFEQVITNLVVNARDAMAEGGAIAIRTRNVSFAGSEPTPHWAMPPGDFVLIEVEDSGCGIPADKLEKIFDPFYTTKPQGEGTGLGLSTVYGIVKQSNGYIFAQSLVGEGTTFRIFLPRDTAQTTTEATAATDTGAGAGAETLPPSLREAAALVAGGDKPFSLDGLMKDAPAKPVDLTGEETILLVEDEPPVRMLTGRALRAKGYTVLEAPSGEEALEILEDENQLIDLMLSDVVMPNMDGPTLIRKVADMRPQLKTLFMSGYAEDAFRANLREGEKFGFLQKPFKLNDLAQAVRRELDSR